MYLCVEFEKCNGNEEDSICVRILHGHTMD